MAEYIERGRLLERARKVTEYDEGGWCTTYQAVPVSTIQKCPAADVAPVVHGEWEFISLDGSLWCSRCKRPSGHGRKAENKYCRNCGAKMDGGTPCRD